MEREVHIERAFRTLGTQIRGSFFRLIALQYQRTPLSVEGAEINGGRYNPSGLFGALYAAPGAPTALRETNILIQLPDGSMKTVPTNPNILIAIDIELSHTVDLTDRDIQTALRIDLRDLLVNWRTIVKRGHMPITQRIGRAARSAGIEALIVPSARHYGEKNIAIIPDQMLTTSRISIVDPAGFPVGTQTVYIGSKVTR